MRKLKNLLILIFFVLAAVNSVTAGPADTSTPDTPALTKQYLHGVWMAQDSTGGRFEFFDSAANFYMGRSVGYTYHFSIVADTLYNNKGVFIAWPPHYIRIHAIDQDHILLKHEPLISSNEARKELILERMP